MKRKFLLLFVLALVGGYAFHLVAQTSSNASAAIHMTPAEFKWGPPPPGLPAGAQLAVLAGDPSKEGGEYTLRAKLPDGYKIAPHYHPVTENVTVLSGTFYLGMGDKFDEKAASPFPAGSYLSAPAQMRHYAWAKGPTVIQIHGIGPFGITYVDPKDDPRNASTPK